ncbi:MAG: GAF domain-containing protein, partial [Aestuariivirga sp.]
SGTKPIHRDQWFDIVHGERRSFVANTIAEISKVFPDFELIASLGCGSVMNLPVVLQGELVATVNMLDEEHHFTPERVAAAEASLAIPAKLCYVLAAQFDRRTGKPD